MQEGHVNMKKKKVVTALIIISLLIAAVVVIFVVRRRKNLPAQSKESISQSVANVVKSAVTTYIPESFPLKKGMKGNNVKIMQDSLAYMGYKPTSDIFVVDGYFGDITLEVVRQYFNDKNKNQVSEAEWKPFYTIYSVNNNLSIVR